MVGSFGLRKLWAATGVIWAQRAQSAEKSPKWVPRASRLRGPKKSQNRVEMSQNWFFNYFDSESVKCRFSKCRFSVLNLNFDFISDGGRTREKQIQKALGSLPPCGNRCRFSESAICSSRVHPPSEIKSNFKFKTLRWRPLRWRLTLSDWLFFDSVCDSELTSDSFCHFGPFGPKWPL